MPPDDGSHRRACRGRSAEMIPSAFSPEMAIATGTPPPPPDAAVRFPARQVCRRTAASAPFQACRPPSAPAAPPSRSDSPSVRAAGTAATRECSLFRQHPRPCAAARLPAAAAHRPARGTPAALRHPPDSGTAATLPAPAGVCRRRSTQAATDTPQTRNPPSRGHSRRRRSGWPPFPART